MSYTYWLVLSWLANHLPQRLGYTLFRRLGWLAFQLGGRWRAAALDNMRHVLGPAASEAQVRATARAAFVQQSINYYFLVRPLIPDEVWRNNHTVVGIEHFERTQAAGKGILFISAHLGQIEHAAEVMRRDFGHNFLAPAELVQPDKLYHWLVAHRERHGGKAVPASDVGGLELVRHLRRGGLVALTADLDTTRGGLPVKFFGAPALLPQGPVRLALLSSAAVIPVFAIRLPNGQYHTTFEAPLVLQRTRDREADVTAAMRQIAAMLERWIGAYPDQWTQFNPIWRWAEESQRSEIRGQISDGGRQTADGRQQKALE